ncbi:hypothetical protein J2Y46_002623 [Microbacterium sp. BE35]|uniref:hypothetical protein n=1 Tax=Microbacterium sp. BE35 TaxID=2817773 RepID=UPI0028605C95|nr:hypothetical protein [Microbacterium sp. BE35]MDR7189797.1 hypothetical protein [Microbacterium sp. BE35]
MIFTTQGDMWTVVDTSGDLTAATVLVVAEPVSGGGGGPLDHVVKDAAAGVLWARTGGLPVGKYRLQVKVTQGSDGPWTYPQSGSATLVVGRSLDDGGTLPGGPEVILDGGAP